MDADHPDTGSFFHADPHLFLQIALNEHGYEAGSVDGRVGPQTRKAIAAYADDNAVKAKEEDVLIHMMEVNAEARDPIKDEQKLDLIKSEVAEHMRDPSSVMLRNLFELIDPAGDRIVCGEVNGKNAYGGYAGFKAFYGLLFMDKNFVVIQIDGEDDPIAFFKCSLSY